MMGQATENEGPGPSPSLRLSCAKGIAYRHDANADERRTTHEESAKPQPYAGLWQMTRSGACPNEPARDYHETSGRQDPVYRFR